MRSREARTTDNELGGFLRARRAALDPCRAGFPDDGRLRRVPGLRREELAQLAHVSVDYIVRLEQGRTRRVSRPVLGALGDALQLAPDERAYLFTLADVTPGPAVPRPGRPQADPQLRQLLATMHDVPAMVLNRRMDVLAWNRAASALLTDFDLLADDERNLIRLTFLDDAYRALYADWPRAARECVAVLRMAAGRHPEDREPAALIAELSNRDPDFRTWWADHRVRGPRQLTQDLPPPPGRPAHPRRPAVHRRHPARPTTRRLHRTPWHSRRGRSALPPAVGGGTTCPERRAPEPLTPQPRRSAGQVPRPARTSGRRGSTG